MKLQICLPLVLRHDESKSPLTARYAILLLYLGQHMASRGSRFKRLSVDAVTEILADIESELSDFTANCVKSPCTQEIALRTFIQRRIMHELERQEETAQKMSSMYLYSFYLNFSVENG
jgi:hypothetical protein